MSVSTDKVRIRVSSPDMLECSLERVQEGASFPGLESVPDNDGVQQGIEIALKLPLYGDWQSLRCVTFDKRVRCVALQASSCKRSYVIAP